MSAENQHGETPKEEVNVTLIRGDQLPLEIRRALRLLVRRANAGDVSPNQLLKRVGNILNISDKN